MPRLRRRLTALGVVLILALGADQLVRVTLLSTGTFRGRRVAPYDPPLFHGAQVEALERAKGLLDGSVEDVVPIGFDRDLGWAPRPEMSLGIDGYDWAGCRDDGVPTAREKDPARTRVAAYGCSFTHGDGVGGADAWPAALEALEPRFEMLNLGVGGYGLDQACLRQLATAADLAPDEVWLGLLPAACLRVTTRFRPIVRHWSSALAFKPRFVLAGDGTLRTLPNPARSLEDVVALCEDQELFLERTEEGDRWIARARPAWLPAGSHPLHWTAAGRLILTAWENVGRAHERHLGPRGAEAHRLLDAIVMLSKNDAEGRGARFRFLILPGPTDLEYLDLHSEGYWSTLVEDLRARNVEVLDLTDALLAARASGINLFLADGHYTVAGNRVVAKALAEATGP
ncbi:hypothetical protein [Engelhardtia mirabilis]|uniref:AlgX/AlgJ SGNH hydrolase-like domain-containing protein n=1 Tax=Engelhardtia mirabilis TaxID=2528011 RepID=A0A518BLD8_9BACT|nr:hypothetical protein Pla133_28790 [Planctomycetes bacterium Pla133]QDV02116.1 hypothetical protein Pla86_28780 [Planctomycetes bacterium Pla86]